MKWLKRLLAALLVLVVVLVGVGFLLPSTVHVARSIAMDAPADEVFPLVNSFENFNKWSPWFGRDPDAEYRIHGPPSGVGAKMTWSSDQPDVGSGSQEIIESVPDERIRTALDFGEQGKATADITFAPAGSGTLVTWSMDSDFGNNLPGRYLGLMFDRWIGADYEQGLANLKRLAEGGTKVAQ